jgi:multiple sugar transport system ATP-binding protein
VASLELNDVRKSYGETLVLDGVSLSVETREFIAFLGPSGSGKSTLLRIVAGLETLDSGEVWLDGRRIDQLPPGKRDVAMVFQHYALYPHMTVRENMAFGLRNAGVPQAEIDERIAQAAASLEIESQLDKKPGQMSGGQRQRVAIGRAIVKAPKLFLLDEPLSNLDAALRNRTRVELAQLRQRVDAAFDHGDSRPGRGDDAGRPDRGDERPRIQQVGAPMELYTARPIAGWRGSWVRRHDAGARRDRAGRRAALRGCGSPAGAEVETRVAATGLPTARLSNLGCAPNM